VTEIEEVYLEEIDFAMKKINDRSIYSHAEGTYGLPADDSKSKITSDN